VAANEYAMFYARLATWHARADVPLAVTFHATVLQTLKERLKMQYYRPLVWTADWLVYVCEAQRRYWQRRRLTGRRTDVIYNGIDTRFWRMEEGARAIVRRALGFSESDLVVGMSAVLRPEKNPVQLVEAVALARRRGIPARALFIGDGPMRPAVEERARRLGVEAETVITGLQQDVRPLLAACDAVALCSHSEALSLAALEALALGRPVLHSEVGGAAEMIEPGRNGYLFAPGDTPALVDRLSALADPALRRRMAGPARAMVELKFSERAMVERYESGLAELPIGRRKRENLRRPANAH
jgi:glycosyltransferase involved in cell wall biosynthesis